MLDLQLIRDQFPALANGHIHLDNPGGTQMTQQSIDRMLHYIQHTNANHGGEFPTSRESDAMIEAAREAFVDLFNARRPEEIVFGANMTSLTLHFSRSLARLLQPGDEIVLTRLDHDANVAPWLAIAEERGCTIRWVDVNPADCTLDLATLEREISPRTRIVAVGYASNAVGTINDVRRVVDIAHRVGALTYIDAVQYAAHGTIDVQALDCDFLVCSAYKFFGPHAGILYGKQALLESLYAYRVRPSSPVPPEKWETGTQNFEGIAACLGAVDYMAW
ncbi:MAG TPA: aminotransferase class V-fold PLP-dependent enzyme, partial [Aggregatilineales bacterium]|nr:aminotransferase class V-fold PLP-dependent enzyme [Aggregatilineales bacterium]